MTEATKTEKPKLRIPEQGPWAQAWKAAAVLGVLGLGVAAVGYTANPERFAFSYLFAFLVVMTVALGAMFFVLVQHLTSAHWSVTVRRTSEFFMAGIVVLPLLFLPLIPSMGQLYPWLGHGAEDHGTAHAQAVEHPPRPEAVGEQHGQPEHPDKPVFVDERGAWHVRTHHDPEHTAHSAIVAKKHGFLNVPFFAVRAVVYFLLWLGIAHLFFTWSTRQDQTGDPKLTVKMQWWAPLSTIVFGLVTSFAAFDWVMSMQPAWYSTMFGVHIFASSAVTSFGVIILTTLALRRAGLLGDTVNMEHYHDLGKLQFGFLVFWGYIAFSEFMLIWYSAIPEETSYFHMRWDIAAWRWVSVGLVALHFIVPFWLIMSRNTKRNLPVLGFTAAWILLMHVLEAYWLVMPYFGGPELEFSMIWLDLACLLGVLGIYLAVVFRRMMRYSLIPVRDPRLERSLHFVNA